MKPKREPEIVLVVILAKNLQMKLSVVLIHIASTPCVRIFCSYYIDNLLAKFSIAAIRFTHMLNRISYFYMMILNAVWNCYFVNIYIALVIFCYFI